MKMHSRNESLSGEENSAESGLRQVVGRFALRMAVIGSSAAVMLGLAHVAEASDYDYGATGAEKSWCKWPSRWKLCERVMHELADDALGKAREIERNTDRSVHNGSADAFRHCYWSGRMNEEFGYDTAKGFGDRHEQNDAQPVAERDMDLFNNEKGRSLALDGGSIYDDCYGAMEQGELSWLAPYK
jgi:hypothetical protein